ncbi:MAG: endonuclease/exonuclease/phosphatase family protein [Alistipes sp.]|nr:endonuclease/exonuclease/phosphatase family protein [Alistipes sp.]
MADIYRQSVRRGNVQPARRRGNRFSLLVLLDVLVVLLTLLLAFATTVAIVARYVSPERMQGLSVVTLAAPIIYLLDLTVMFYWVVRRRVAPMVASFVVVAVATGYLSLYYKIDLARDYESKYIERNFVRVLSYNTFGGRKDGLADYILRRNADVVCLQEASRDDANFKALLERYSATPATDLNCSSVILSRHRILRSGAIDSLPNSKSLWADVKIGNRVVRVFNLHLHSTAINPKDTEFIESHSYISDTARSSKISSIINRLVENNCRRAVEAESVHRAIDESRTEVVVCGDFNDVPLSYTYHTILGDELCDTFDAETDGYAYTFDRYFKLLRIDYVLHSPSIETISYEVDYEASYSDHFPVFVRLKLK